MSYKIREKTRPLRRESPKASALESALSSILTEDSNSTLSVSEVMEFYVEACKKMGIKPTSSNIVGISLSRMFRSVMVKTKLRYLCRFISDQRCLPSDAGINLDDLKPRRKKASFRQVDVIPDLASNVAITSPKNIRSSLHLAQANQSSIEARIAISPEVTVYIPIEGLDKALLQRLGGLQ